MTKKKWTNVFLALLFSVATLSSVACEKEDGGENNVRVWSTYNTLKVLRDYEGPPYTGGKYPDLGADLEIKMCLGEPEGAQLLVTPEKAVKSAYLHKGTLKDEEGTDLSEDSVTVYYQYYHELLTKTTSQTNYNYPLSWVPDMIVPMEICAEYEENKIGAGHNQGFTVEVKTTPETKAGVYSGVFVLELDGKKTNIPVRVEVLNIDISESHGSTSIWTSSTTGRMSGEYNTTSYYKN